MIELFSLIPSWYIAIVCAIAMLVNRAGASRVFFDVIGVFYANRMLKDAKAKMATLESLALDGLSGIEDAASMFGAKMAALVDDVIPIATEIADARIEFEKFVQGAENSDQIALDVINIGEGFGFAADQALLAAARMAQLSSVVGPDVIPTATELGMQFGLIGGMESEEAMTKLINLQQQTGFMLGDLTTKEFKLMDAQEQNNMVRKNTIQVLNQLNTIENRSAATMQHMTFVMNQFAAQAHLANESIAGMAAQSATLIEAGEEQGKAGRALKQIYARIGADTSGAASEIERLGVATKDVSGDMRALTTIVRELKPEWEELNGEQKTNLAVVIAGTHHYARFIKLMENTDRTSRLMLEAQLGLNPAMDEVNIRLENQVTQLREAEARLKKYKGILGDTLMPATIKATEIQAEYNAALASIFRGKGGGVLQDLYTAAEIIRQVGAGFYQNYINIVQLNVALTTQRVLVAALRGEEMIREDFMASKMRSRHKFNVLITEEQQMQRDVMAQAKINLGQIQQTKWMEYEAVKNITREEAALFNIRTAAQNVIFEEQVARSYNMNLQKEALQNEASLLQMGIVRSGVQKEAIANKITEAEVAEQEARLRAYEMNQHMMKLNLHEKQLQVSGFNTEELRKQYRLGMFQHMVESQQVALLQIEWDKQEDITQELMKQSAALEQKILKSMLELNVQDDIVMAEHEKLAAMQQTLSVIQAIIQGRNAEEAAAEQALQTEKLKSETAAMGSNIMMWQQRSMAVMAAGSALMMYSNGLEDADKRQEAMRMSIILMNMAMIPQLLGMFKMTSAMVGGAAATEVAATMSLKDAYAKGVETSATTGAAAALHGYANAAIAGAVATQSFVAAAAPMAAVLGGAVVVALALNKILGSDLVDAYDDSVIAGTASADAVAAAWEAQEQTQEELLQGIVDKQDEIKVLEGLEGSRHEAAITQLQNEIDLNRQLLGIYSAQEAEQKGFDSLAETFFGTKDDMAALEEQFGTWTGDRGENWFSRMFVGGWGGTANPEQIANRLGDGGGKKGLWGQVTGWAAPTSEEWLGFTLEAGENAADAMERMTAENEDLLANNKEFAAFLESQGIESWEEYVAALEDGTLALEELEKQQPDAAMAAISGEIENATQLLDAFNNKREELFYGFKAGNLTGDLVRQIEQKGVENFVANTEIIMTNNFNGMTTDQVADEILRKINERAVTNGINLSTVT